MAGDGFHMGKQSTLLVQYAKPVRYFGDEEVSAGILVDVCGEQEVSPLGYEFPISRKHLYSIVFPVAHVKDTPFVHQYAVGYVELSRLRGSGFSPGGFQIALGGESMDTGVAVTVGSVQVARR